MAPKRGRPPKRAGRSDAWQNTLTGLGTTRDKGYSTTFDADIVDNETASTLWRGNDLAARVIETLPNEMLRAGFCLKVKGGEEDGLALEETLTARWEDLGLTERLREGLCYSRAYGGGAILLGANDGRPMTEPLDIARVRSLDWLTSLEARELQPSAWYGDPQAPKFGQPSRWRLCPHSPSGSIPSRTVEVHETRLLIFQGIKVSRRDLGSMSGWGDSILTRVWRVLRDHDSSFQSASVLLHDFSQAIFKMKGLADLVAQDGASALAARMEAVELGRSIMRGVLIDVEEEFERKSTPLTGLPELLDRMTTRLAAAADMPITLLMGQSPGGLNATGESDIRFFYDRVSAEQSRTLRPAVEKVCKILFATMGGEPDTWSIRFTPLWQPTEKERVETKRIQAEVDRIYLDTGVLSAEEIAINRFGVDGESLDTKIDFEAREALEPAAPEPVLSESEQATREAELDALKNPGPAAQAEAPGDQDQPPQPDEA